MKHGQQSGLTRQRKGKVSFVDIFASPGCSKLYLSFKGRIAIELPREWVQREKSPCLLKGCGEGERGVNSRWHCFQRKCSV